MKPTSSKRRKKDVPALQAAARLLQQGQVGSAVAQLNALLSHAPGMGSARLMLADAKYLLGQSQEALKQLSICAKHDTWATLSADDQCHAAALTLSCGDPAAALQLYNSVLDQYPEHFDARLGAARCHIHLKNYQIALDILQLCSQEQQRTSDSWNLLTGTAHLMQDDWVLAKLHLKQCLKINPRNALAHNNLGLVYKKEKDPDSALSCFHEALSYDKNLVDAAINIASIWMDGTSEQLDKAHALLLQYKAKHSKHYLFLHTLGQVEHRRKNWDNALEYYTQAHQLNPKDADIITNIGIWHFDKKNYSTAIEWFQKALDIAPEHEDANHFIRVAYSNIGRVDLQIPYLEKAIQHNPLDPGARFLLAWNLLGAGDWELGFREYAFRPSRRDIDILENGVPLAKALPDEMKGDRILLAQEQGIGDELFFLRFLPILAQRGAELHYFTRSKLAPVLQRLGLFAQVWNDPPPAEIFKAGVLVGDLPHLLRFGSSDTPPPALTLSPLSAYRNSAASILKAFGPPPYVGITWRAGTDFLVERTAKKRLLDKSIPIDDIARWIPPNATVVSLQRNPYPDDVSHLAKVLGRPVLDAAVFNDKLEQMLGLLSQLDHYFAVSNTNIHLAAGIGLSCTVFVPMPPEWRWMQSGDKSVWFPNCRVVRQRADGSWPADGSA